MSRWPVYLLLILPAIHFPSVAKQMLWYDLSLPKLANSYNNHIIMQKCDQLITCLIPWPIAMEILRYILFQRMNHMRSGITTTYRGHSILKQTNSDYWESG